MCHAYGSIDQATAVCPMCKFYKPSGARCPHIKDTCRNRSSHPRHDVVFIKNAEVQTFNGCGYCKWARSKPPPQKSGYQNPGWPGCCRPPLPNEQSMIQASDWRAVSMVHHVPIPSDIKAILDGLLSRNSPVPSLGFRGPGGSPSIPPLDRRSSTTSNSSNKSNSPSGKTLPLSIPGKTRSGDSPPQVAAPFDATSSLSRGSGAHMMPSSLPDPSDVERFQIQRRQSSAEHPGKRIDTAQPLHSSPGRRSTELEGTLGRHNSGRRPTLPGSTTPFMSGNKVDGLPQVRRRASISSTNAPSTPPKSISPPSSRTSESRSGSLAQRSSSRRISLEESMASVNISSAASSSSGSSSHGSTTDGTVTSDGGFTDYLSDESEAELQRQAEAKAAIVAQNQAEELEFKAARQQLTHVDLRPPKSWNPSSTGQGTGSRLQGPSTQGNAYVSNTQARV